MIANERSVLEARLLRGDDQRGFCRVPKHCRPAVGALDLGIVAQRPDTQGQSDVRGDCQIQRMAVDEKVTSGRVAGAGHVDAAFVDDESAHGHLVPRERARLVSADDSGGTECLDRGKAADDGSHARHALHPERQRNGGHRGQPLRDSGDCQGNTHLEHVKQAVPTPPAGADDDHAEHEHDAD